MVLIACQSPAVQPQGELPADVSAAAPLLAEQVVAQTDQSRADTVELTAEELPNEAPADLWQRIRQDLSWQETQGARIDKAREGYLRHSTHLPVVADRADYYLYYIVEEVQRRNMPMEIALIPMLESSMDPFASSPSGAAGLWQIMPATGTHLGLEQDAWYDGRHSLRDSTNGALDYLESLYKQFDEDWFLALAAYNAGTGNISRAQKANEAQGLGTDYWSLKLRRQASDYVPKLIALAQIVAEPERFNVDMPALENAPTFEVVDTRGVLQMSQAAELAGVDLDTLRALNPGQLRGTLSPGRPPEILVPIDSAERFEYALSKLNPEDLVQSKTYRIKPGDSLGRIAQQFDIDVSDLQALNSIDGSHIQAGDVLKIPGGSSTDSASDSSSTGSLTVASNTSQAAQGYRVRKGDSLYGIAGKFKISINDIMSWNSLTPGDFLKPGQQLKLYR